MQRYEEKCLVYRINRTIFFFDEVESESVLEAIKLLNEIEIDKNKKPIEFVINSIGGACADGLALYDRLRQSKCEIITIGTGMVASIALLIYLAGDTRLLTENTRLLNHQGYAEITGKTSDIEVDYKELKLIEDIVNTEISNRTGIPLNKINKDIKISDKWFGAEQALEEGYAQEIIKNKRTRRRKKK